MNIEATSKEFYSAIEAYCETVGRKKRLLRFWKNPPASPEDIIRVCAVSAARILRSNADSILAAPSDRTLAPSDYARLRSSTKLAAELVPTEWTFFFHVGLALANSFAENSVRHTTIAKTPPEANPCILPHAASTYLDHCLWNLTQNKLKPHQQRTAHWKIAATASGTAIAESRIKYGMSLENAGCLYRETFGTYLSMAPERIKRVDQILQSRTPALRKA